MERERERERGEREGGRERETESCAIKQNKTKARVLCQYDTSSPSILTTIVLFRGKVLQTNELRTRTCETLVNFHAQTPDDKTGHERTLQKKKKKKKTNTHTQHSDRFQLE